MKKIIYTLKNINDDGIEQKICELWTRAQYIKKEKHNVTFIYEGDEYCVSLELYFAINRKSYAELLKMVEKLSKVDYKISVTGNEKIIDEVRIFAKKFQIYLATFRNKELSEEILKKSSKELLINIYLALETELINANIDIFNFISKDEIFDESVVGTMFTNGIMDRIEFKEIMYRFKEDYKEQEQDVEQLNNSVIEKFNNKKKGKFYYEKLMLLIKGLDEKDEQKKQRYIDTLLKIGFNEKDILCLCKNELININVFKEMYDIPNLKEMLRKSLKYMPLHDVMRLYSEINQEDILKYVNLKKITFQDLKREIEDFTLNSTIIAIFLKRLCVKEKIHFSVQELNELLLISKKTPIDYARANYILNISGVCNDVTKLIEAYEEQVEYVIKDQDKNSFEEVLPIEVNDIIKYFNSERIVKLVGNYINQIQNEQNEERKKELMINEGKFFGFYKVIKEIQENGTVSKGDLGTELIDEIKKSGNEKERILITLELFKYGVITAEYVEEIVDDNNIDELLEMYDNGMGDKVLIGLYYCGIISKENLATIYEFNDEKLKQDNLERKLENREISQADLVMMYLIGIISIEILSKFVDEKMKWGEIIEVLPEVDKIEKIGELYLNKLITFEDLQELKETNIISEKEANTILGRRNVIDELRKGLKSEKTRGEEGKNRNKRTNEVEQKKEKEKVEIEDKELLLINLGYDVLKNEQDEILVVAGGSFEGYRVYVNKQYHTILFEGEGASYLTHEHQAQNFIKIQEGQESEIEGTRSEWASLASEQRNARKTGDEEAIIRAEGNKTLRRRLHTRKWGENIVQSMVEISTIFMDGSQEEKTKYIRELSKRLSNENKSELEYISGLFEEKRAKSR